MIDFEQKYNQILTRVERLLHFQKEFIKWHASSDLDKLKRMHSEFEKEIKERENKQQKLFY